MVQQNVTPRKQELQHRRKTNLQMIVKQSPRMEANVARLENNQLKLYQEQDSKRKCEENTKELRV